MRNLEVERDTTMVQVIQEYIDYIIKQRPFAKDILNSYKSLVELMDDLEISAPQIHFEKKVQQLKAKEGFPLFSREDLPLDFGAASTLLSRIAGYLSHEQEQERKAMENCVAQIQKDIEWAPSLFKAILKKDEEKISGLAAQVGLEPARLFFLGKLSIRPSLEKLRDACAAMIDKEVWDQGYCPLCGSEPNMAYLDKKGKRHLHCELCGEEWPYPRVNCPFCRNEDQQALGYFHRDKEHGLRVDFCKKCQRYIKTIDRREFELETPMDLEYLATLHLDILAEKEGFK